MVLSKDILNHLQLQSFYIIQDNVYCMCYPLEVDFPLWKLSLDTDAINETKPVTLKIKYKDDFLFYTMKLVKYSSDDLYGFIYEANILDQESTKEKNEFLESISILNTKIKSWDYRKEERYDIGTSEAKGKQICFKSLEQNIIIDKVHLPCIVNNLSFMGAKITTYEANFQVNNKLFLELSFIEPIEQVLLQGTIRNCYMKRINDTHIISIVSMEFNNPSVTYKERLSAFIEKLKKEN